MKLVDGGPGCAPLGTTHPIGLAFDKMRNNSASMHGLDVLGCADGNGAGSTYELDSSSASEASNDMLSSMGSHSFPPNETMLLAFKEGCSCGREKWTGEPSQCGKSEARGCSFCIGSFFARRRVPLPRCFFLTGS